MLKTYYDDVLKCLCALNESKFVDSDVCPQYQRKKAAAAAEQVLQSSVEHLMGSKTMCCFRTVVAFYEGNRTYDISLRLIYFANCENVKLVQINRAPCELALCL